MRTMAAMSYEIPDLQTARERYTASRTRAREATRQMHADRHVLEVAEQVALDAAADSGDLDRCLRELGDALVRGWHSRCSGVVKDFITQACPGGPIDGWGRLEGHPGVLVPTLGDLGPDVPEGAGAGLLAVLDRFAAVFDLPAQVTLAAGDVAEQYLTVDRVTGQAVLATFDHYRQENRTLAAGPLEDVLRSPEA